MFQRQPFINSLVFGSIVLIATFILVLGSKLILSRCALDENGKCITVDGTSDVASEIAELNQQLAVARANAYEACFPPEPEEPVTPPEPQQSEIDVDEWNSGNTKVLEGCWQLEYDWTMFVGGDPNRPVDLIDWGFCLEAAGSIALQDLSFSDGAECTSLPLYYEFLVQEGSTQRLRLSDNEDLQCTQGSFNAVAEREMLCSLDTSGDYAECKSRRIRSGSTGEWGDEDIILRRRP